MQRDILFYQANFDPEVNRMLEAEKAGQEKHFLLFQNKTLKIVDSILSLSKKYAEKEEWFAVRNIVENVKFATSEMKEVVSKFGIPFSNKYVHNLSS